MFPEKNPPDIKAPDAGHALCAAKVLSSSLIASAGSSSLSICRDQGQPKWQSWCDPTGDLYAVIDQAVYFIDTDWKWRNRPAGDGWRDSGLNGR